MCPDRPTIAALTVIGINRDAADEAVATCTGTVEFHGTGSAALSPIEPFQPQTGPSPSPSRQPAAGSQQREGSRQPAA